MNNHDAHEESTTLSKNYLSGTPTNKRPAKWLYKAILMLSILSFSLLEAWAQNAYAVHANIIYHFTKYINWPDDMKTGEFIIGVVGDTPLYEELKSFTSKRSAAGQPITVKKFAPNTTAYNCHILFVADDASGNMKRIAASTAETPTLLVTESEGLSHKGACINFVLVDDHLKLEINKTNIERRSLGIASELLNLGIIVK
ncbi:MAG TPA: YfiR family protein [Niastella sp.]|nr:YfiR family protein [Niastella sp.]